jgi:uncharacterized membrane protein
MNTAVIYINAMHNGSALDKENFLRDFCDTHKIKVVACYIDTTPKYPEFNKMYEDILAENTKVDFVIVKNIKDLDLDGEQRRKLITDFKKMGTTIRAIRVYNMLFFKFMKWRNYEKDRPGLRLLILTMLNLVLVILEVIIRFIKK